MRGAAGSGAAHRAGPATRGFRSRAFRGPGSRRSRGHAALQPAAPPAARCVRRARGRHLRQRERGARPHGSRGGRNAARDGRRCVPAPRPAHRPAGRRFGDARGRGTRASDPPRSRDGAARTRAAGRPAGAGARGRRSPEARRRACLGPAHRRLAAHRRHGHAAQRAGLRAGRRRPAAPVRRDRPALALRCASRLHDDPLGAGERAAVLDRAPSPRACLGPRDRARRVRSGDRVRVGRRRLRRGRHALGRRDVHRTTGCVESYREPAFVPAAGRRQGGAIAVAQRRGALLGSRRRLPARGARSDRARGLEPRRERAAVQRGGPGLRCDGGDRARRGRDEFRGTGADVARGACGLRG